MEKEKITIKEFLKKYSEEELLQMLYALALKPDIKFPHREEWATAIFNTLNNKVDKNELH